MATDKKPDTNVKTALRVIEIIEVFARETKPLSLSELARHLDAPVSSCLALLRTLASLGYVYEAGRRQGYYPTGRLLAMAQRISKADPILEKVLPSLEELRDTTSETVVFAKLDLMNNRVVYLDVLASPHPISYVAVAGAQPFAPSRRRFSQYSSQVALNVSAACIRARTFSRCFSRDGSFPRAISSRASSRRLRASPKPISG